MSQMCAPTYSSSFYPASPCCFSPIPSRPQCAADSVPRPASHVLHSGEGDCANSIDGGEEVLDGQVCGCTRLLAGLACAQGTPRAPVWVDGVHPAVQSMQTVSRACAFLLPPLAFPLDPPRHPTPTPTPTPILVGSSPYVRKTAAHAISKVYSLDNEQKEELVTVISRLLGDRSVMVHP